MVSNLSNSYPEVWGMMAGTAKMPVSGIAQLHFAGIKRSAGINDWWLAMGDEIFPGTGYIGKHSQGDGSAGSDAR